MGDKQFNSQDDFVTWETEDGLGIEIVNYIGTGKDVVIPLMIDNLPVVSIGDDSFTEKGLSSIIIPDSVKEIKSGALSDNFLKSILLPSSLTKIGRFAFMGNLLERITIPDSVKNIEHAAFRCNQISEVVWSNNLSTLETKVFESNQLKLLIIPENISIIKFCAFDENPVVTIKIPDNVTFDETYSVKPIHPLRQNGGLGKKFGSVYSGKGGFFSRENPLEDNWERYKKMND
jgi:hypothetical protein